MLTVRERIDESTTATMPDIGVSWVELMTTIPQLMPSGVLPVYRPSEIVYGGKRYILRAPLECEVHLERDESGGIFYCVEYSPFDFWGMGVTLSDAIAEFSSDFAFTYERDRELIASGVSLGGSLAGVYSRMKELVIGGVPVINH